MDKHGGGTCLKNNGTKGGFRYYECQVCTIPGKDHGCRFRVEIVE